MSLDALSEDVIEVVGVWGGTTTLERREARYLIGDRGKIRGRLTGSERRARSAADFQIVVELLIDTFEARYAAWQRKDSGASSATGWDS